MEDTGLHQILTVSRLTALITELIEVAFPLVWVEGEISGLATPSSGHIYFTLKDDSSQVRVVMFKNQARSLGLMGDTVASDRRTGNVEPDLFSTGGRRSASPAWRPADGQHVLVTGRVGVYAPRGEYQLIADYIQPVGIGAMMLALEQLKKRLSEKGYFAEGRKRVLPLLPGRIAIVTSRTGAALFDILRVIFERMPNGRVLIVPVRVQGEGSEHEIARGIQIVNRMGLADVIIVGRGGGSIEDLWAFNTEAVADAIFHSTIPVVSAVGHEIDFTVADLVADVRAPTPTAAAQSVVPRLDDLLMSLDTIRENLIDRISYHLTRHREQCLRLATRIRSPKQDIDRFRLLFEMAHGRLRSGMIAQVSGRKSTLASYSHALTRLSPEAVLARGYSITERADDGAIIRSTSDINIGGTARIRLHKGTLTADIIKKEPDETS